MSVIGLMIKEVRTRKGLTQRELAKQTNFSNSYIGDLETGRVTPSLKALEIVANYLEMDISCLLGSKCCYQRLKEESINHYGYEIEMCKDCPLKQRKDEAD